MKITLPLLLALGAATPALAQQAPDNDHHHDNAAPRGDHNGGEHQDRGNAQQGPRGAAPDRGRPGGNPAGFNGSDAANAPRFAPIPGREAPGFRGDRNQPGGVPGAVRSDDRQRWQAGGPAPQAGVRPDRGGQSFQNGPGADRGQPGAHVDGRGYQPNVNGDRRDWRNGPGDQRGGPAYQGGGRGDWRGGPGGYRGGLGPGAWSRGWREGSHDEWRAFRDDNRDRFRAPPYYAPRGFGYRPWYAGIRIQPWFYGRNYWVSNPYYYDLPAPPPGCQWVRYFNDVALVNVYDGTVLDVVPGFFF